MVDTEIYGTDYNSQGEVTSTGDIGLTTELDNVEQAIRNRLLTRLGTYPTIDTDYGSEIHLCIGEKLNTRLLNELEVYIRNCMLEEPRVYTILDLTLTQVGHDTIMIQLLLQLVDGSELGFEEEINTLG